MRFEDLFKVDDDEITERISERYPVLTDTDKERLYERIKLKLGESYDETEITAKGTERIKRNVWRKFMNIAASLMLAGAVTGTTVFLMRNMPSQYSDSVLTDFNEREKASVLLTDKFLSASNLINGYADIDTTEKRLVFFEYSSLNPKWTKDDVVYSMLDNSEYTPDNAVSAIESLVTDEYFEVLKDNGGEFFGCDIDVVTGTEKGENPPSFKEFIGDMYYIQRNSDIPVFKNTPQITEENTSDFKVSRTTDKEYIFHIIWDGAKWLICDIERT